MKDIKPKVFGLWNPLVGLLFILNVIPGQGKNKDSLTPTPAVYTGQLENGFTYFIKPVEKGKQVQMELFVKSGFQRQREDEFDLAHFLEHLAIDQFLYKAYQNNGRIKEALITSQLKLPGSTGFDHTRYGFYYPKGDSYLRDAGLEYFAEIAKGNLQLDPYILNTEKAIFFEELIQRGGWRTFHKKKVDALLSDCLSKPIFPDSLWNHIKTYNVNQTQQFLENWYRPELSALVIVGPIEDLEVLKARIKEVFSSSGSKTVQLPDRDCSEEFLERPPHFVVVNNGNGKTGHRKEVIFHLLFRDGKKIKDLSTAQWEWIKPTLSQSITRFLLNQDGGYNKRFSANATWHKELPVLDFRIRTVKGQEAQGFQEAYALLKEIKQNGIPDDQWHDIKENKIREIRNKDTTSVNYWMYVLEQQALYKKEAAAEVSLINWWTKLTVNDFNAILQSFIPDRPDDIAAIVPLTFQENEEYWKIRIRTWLATSPAGKGKTSSFDLVPSVFNDEFPLRGYKELSSDILGARVFKLSNGLQVILKEISKPVNKEGRISIRGFRRKGALGFPEEKYYTAMLSPFVIRNAGVGNLNSFQLQNLISETSIGYVYPYVTDTESGITGNSGEKDLETLFQILYNYIAAPRKDSIAFTDWQSREWEDFLQPKIGKVNSDFKSKVNDKLRIPAIILGVSERYRAAQEISMEEAYYSYNSLFSNANDFIFLISSSVEAEKLLPLIDKYLGNLPNSEKGSEFSINRRGDKTLKGQLNELLEVPSIPSENVMLSVQYLKMVKLSDWKTRLQIKVLAEILNKRINQLRHLRRRGIYDRSIGYSANQEVSRPGISITIPTIEEQGDLILGDIQDIVMKIIKEPLKQKELKTVLQQKILPEYLTEWEDNISATSEHLYDFYGFGIVPPEESKVKEYISSLTPERIREFAQQFLIEENKFVLKGKSSLK